MSRRKGQVTKITAELRAAAKEYTAEALKVLVKIMRNAKAPAVARIQAARELLDRGHGRSVQPMKHEGEVTIRHEEALAEVQARVDEIRAAKERSVH